MWGDAAARRSIRSCDVRRCTAKPPACSAPQSSASATTSPSRVVTNDDLAKLMTTSDEWIVQRTGIKERRFIEHAGIGASDLAVPACQHGARARRARREGRRRHHLRDALARPQLPRLGVLPRRTSWACPACRRSTCATSAPGSSMGCRWPTPGCAPASTATSCSSAPRCTRRASSSPIAGATSPSSSATARARR